MKKLITFLCVVFLVSCSKEAIVPDNEAKLPDNEIDLGHDNWAKVVFVFTEGEMKSDGDVKFIGYEDNPDFSFKTVQKFTLESINGEVKRKADTINLITGKNYGLEIRYYNAQNKLINKQFTTADMAPIHQHFLITDPIAGTVKQTEKNTIDYVYRDTSPVDKILNGKDVRLRKASDPLGFKGYFNVFKKPKHEFDLNVVLVHVLGGDKLDKKGNPYPFYAPSPWVIGTRDLSQKIPMKIIAEEGSSTYIEDLAKVFSITKERVRKEISDRKLGRLKL